MTMSCLILAAGMGSRLGYLTSDKPKALIELFGKSLIKHQIETLNSLEINQIGIATGYCAIEIQKLGYPTFFNPYYTSTNMVYSLFSSVDFFENSDTDLLISYGDIIYQKNNLRAVINCKEDITIMVDNKWIDLWSVRNENPINDAETLKLDNEGFILELGKKPKDIYEIEGQYTGLIFIKRNKISEMIDFYKKMSKISNYDGKSFNQMFMTTFLQSLINFGWKINATKVNNGWLEIDTLEDIKIYENLFKKGLLKQLWSEEK